MRESIKLTPESMLELSAKTGLSQEELENMYTVGNEMNEDCFFTIEIAIHRTYVRRI